MSKEIQKLFEKLREHRKLRIHVANADEIARLKQIIIREKNRDVIFKKSYPDSTLSFEMHTDGFTVKLNLGVRSVAVDSFK